MTVSAISFVLTTVCEILSAKSPSGIFLFSFRGVFFILPKFLLNVSFDFTHDKKLSKFKNKVDNFNEIRRIQAQYDMDIIDKAEYKAKMRELGEDV